MASLKRNRSVAKREAIPGVNWSEASKPRRNQRKFAVASNPPASKETPNLGEKSNADAVPAMALKSKLPFISKGKILSSFILILPVIA